jgi:UDP-N-acetylglucosamine acyltransferase
MSSIHPTAIVHPKAILDSTANVGPYTVIDGEVKIQANCQIGPHCYLTGNTVIGSDTKIHAGCVIGDSPQDLSYQGVATKLVVGEGNVFREHVTVHRGTAEGSATEIGNANYFMAHAHVAHNCKIGNHVILANAVLLGGYVQVEDRAFLGGNTAVHQFCRVGTLAIIGGVSRITKDVPPYCTVTGENDLIGLNSIGMKRAGFPVTRRAQLKAAYMILFTKGLNLTQALAELEKEKMSLEVEHLVSFVRKTKRGVCTTRKQIPHLSEVE